MARAMRRLQYRGKKMEYIRKDALSHILAKMCRWGLTVRDIEIALQKMKGGRQ
jgi:hypothetical protein